MAQSIRSFAVRRCKPTTFFVALRQNPHSNAWTHQATKINFNAFSTPVKERKMRSLCIVCVWPQQVWTHASGEFCFRFNCFHQVFKKPRTFFINLYVCVFLKLLKNTKLLYFYCNDVDVNWCQRQFNIEQNMLILCDCGMCYGSDVLWI